MKYVIAKGGSKLFYKINTNSHLKTLLNINFIKVSFFLRYKNRKENLRYSPLGKNKFLIEKHERKKYHSKYFKEIKMIYYKLYFFNSH